MADIKLSTEVDSFDLEAAIIQVVNAASDDFFEIARTLGLDPLTDLKGRDLSGVRLELGSNLVGANLEGANLSDADLEGADLSDANLIGAHLYGADLECAHLSGANLIGADLRGAHLYGVDLRD